MPMRFYAAWAFVVFTPCLGRKEVRKMRNTQQHFIFHEIKEWTYLNPY